jgi:membrane protein implicated in regulation of membrane protease activity
LAGWQEGDGCQALKPIPEKHLSPDWSQGFLADGHEKFSKGWGVMGNLLWWYWILLGIGLVLLELVVPAFAIFWFGLGAILTGLLVAMLPGLPIEGQLLVFSASSIGFTFLWFRVFRPRRRASSAITDEKLAIGQTGIAATRAKTPGETGQVVFSVPVLGYESWSYSAEEPINTGDRVRVIAVLEGSREEGARRTPQKVLKVEKIG